MDGFGDYEQHDALGLAHLIRAGEVTAHEVLREAIARIERRNPPLNAVITTTFERAQRRIADGTGDGMFAGVPFLLKGLNQALEGVPLADGSRSLRTWVPSYTSTLVQRYEAAGLVILGATNVPEFGLVPVTERICTASAPIRGTPRARRADRRVDPRSPSQRAWSQPHRRRTAAGRSASRRASAGCSGSSRPAPARRAVRCMPRDGSA